MMFEHETNIRVRYGKTDQMGYLYYGKYALFYEVGRVEALRSLGMSYSELESEYGILMPVTQLRSRYLRPARYDDLIRVRTYLKKKPVRMITFYSELFDEEDRLINKGIVSLAFVRDKNKKPIELPKVLNKKLSPYFE